MRDRLRFWKRRQQTPPTTQTRRLTVTITGHAVDQARERYANDDLEAADVLADVAAALRDQRLAASVPHGRGRKARDGASCAWTADLARVYVVIPHTSSRYTVVTALPPIDEPHALRRVGVTAVAAALASAGIIGGPA